MRLRIAGGQLPVSNDIAENVAAIHRAIDFAIAEEAEILLTPEGSLSGYRPDFDPAATQAALEEITTRARRAGLALALGTCFIEPEDALCYNQIRFYDSDGAFLGFHSKILRCGTMTEPVTGEINHYATTPLRTFEVKGVPIGGLICNDLWANPMCTPMPDPHLTQQLARMGARIVFHAINGGRDGSPMSGLAWQYHESNLRMRAMAGHLWIVTVDNCHPQTIPASAPSGVLSPAGEWMVRVPAIGERCFVHTVVL
jgi:predicted amidohydrolase